jgi:hypothetical protein
LIRLFPVEWAPMPAADELVQRSQSRRIRRIMFDLDEGAPSWPRPAFPGVHVGCFEILASEPIRGIPDLKGKTVGVPATGSGPYMLLASIASYVGLDPAKDIRWVRFRRYQRDATKFWPRARIGLERWSAIPLLPWCCATLVIALIPENTDRTEWQTTTTSRYRPWRPSTLLAASACLHRLATPPLASTTQIGTTERWAPRVLFPTRDLAKGVAMAPSEKALQIVALQR